MTEEELERLYMDIYDNGIFEYGYKEKFKRYINNRLGKLEKENAELKEALKGKVCKCMTYFNFKDLEKQLTKAKELLKKLYLEIRGYMNDQGFDMNVINEVYDFIKSEVENDKTEKTEREKSLL